MSTARLRDILFWMWAYNNKFSFLVFNLDKVLKNSTGEKISYIWQI